MIQVAIIVPGIMGSVLKRNDEIVWPGPVTSLMLSYTKMNDLLRDDLVATDCIRSYFITNQYQQLIDDLETCGFSESNKTLIVAAYDWRKDNADSARVLAQHIDNAIALHGPETEISLIGHSMGGLVSRYYLESGYFNSRTGFMNVCRLFTLGTPHRGAAIALPLVLGFEKRLFLSKEQVRQIASDERYPSAYQLLPPQGEPFAWDGSANGEYQNLDIYTATVASQLGLLRANIEAAQRFHSALKFSKRPEHVRYFCFTGTRQTTATHVLLSPLEDGRYEPVKIEREDSGDGTVPIWSGFLSDTQRMFVGGEHGTIYQNRDLRRSLATLLGMEGYLKGVPEQVEVSLRDKVVDPSELLHVVITYDVDVQDFTGVLTIERATISQTSGKVEGFGAPIVAQPIEYHGLGMETFTVALTAPNVRGVYRVAFRNELGADPSGYDELIVQEP